MPIKTGGSSKHQGFKLQISSKYQGAYVRAGRTRTGPNAGGGMELGDWRFSGAWDLGLGASGFRQVRGQGGPKDTQVN